MYRHDPFRIIELNEDFTPKYHRDRTPPHTCVPLSWTVAKYTMWIASYGLVFALGYLMKGYEDYRQEERDHPGSQ